MEQDKNLDRIIKSSFEKINQGAPDNLWGKLSSALDNDAIEPEVKVRPLDSLNEKIRESFSRLNKKAPRQVWPAINRQLNTDRVWEGISNELDNNPFSWPLKRIAAAFLLLLLSGAATYLFMPNNDPFSPLSLEAEVTSLPQDIPAIDPATEKGYQKDSLKAAARVTALAEGTGLSASSSSAPAFVESSSISGINPPKQSALFVSKKTADDKASSESSTSSEVPQVLSNAVFEKNTRGAREESAIMLSINENQEQAHREIIPFDAKGKPFIYEEIRSALPLLIIHVDTTAREEVVVAAFEEEKFIEEKASKAVKLRKFNAGPVITYNSSWLLNNETRSSYDKNSLISTDLTYKENWGLAINYSITEKSSIATEVYVVGKAGQQYRMYQEGEYLKKGLELHYFKLYLQYQQNFLFYGENNSNWFTAKAGAYAGSLQKKLGEIRQEENSYANLDYGVKLALGQENSFGRFILGYGISAERGLNNVFRGSERLPAEFNKTYIFNVGSYLNMRFVF